MSKLFCPISLRNQISDFVNVGLLPTRILFILVKNILKREAKYLEAKTWLVLWFPIVGTPCNQKLKTGIVLVVAYTQFFCIKKTL